MHSPVYVERNYLIPILNGSRQYQISILMKSNINKTFMSQLSVIITILFIIRVLNLKM